MSQTVYHHSETFDPFQSNTATPVSYQQVSKFDRNPVIVAISVVSHSELDSVSDSLSVSLNR